MLRAAFVCLTVCLLCTTTHQLSTRGNLLLPQQTDQESTNEELHEGKVKATELMTASRRKALHQRLLTLGRIVKRPVFYGVNERRPALALCRSADTYRRRGPPLSIPSS
jgi:hypothetical protein